MKIKDYKCVACEGDEFYFQKNKNVENAVSIHCSYCGKFFKWASKDEKNLMHYEPKITEVRPINSQQTVISNGETFKVEVKPKRRTVDLTTGTVKEFVVKVGTPEEYKADMEKLLAENGLKDAINKYTDMIAEALPDNLSYGVISGIYEWLTDILFLAELWENKYD